MRVIVSAIFRDFEGRILLARRRADSKYTTPGGKVEEGETIENALKRETLEESGIKIDSLVKSDYVECKNKLIVCFEITGYRGEPRHKEPEKHGPWEWLYPRNVASELTEGLVILHNLGKI